MDEGSNRCAYCGDLPEGADRRRKTRRSERLILEHVIPRSRGGDDSVENTAWACGACNGAKGNLMLLEWVMVREGVFWRTRDGSGYRLILRCPPYPSRAIPSPMKPARVAPPARAKRARAT